MDDIQFWIYIIFGIIYFIGRAFKKSQQKPEPKRPRSPLETEEQSGERPMTFEELFEQVTGQKRVSETTDEVDRELEKIDEPFSYDREYLEQTKQPAKQIDDEEARRVYEQAVASAGKEEKQTETTRRFKEFKIKSKRNQTASEIRAMLQRPSDARKAIILSEILNRKY